MIRMMTATEQYKNPSCGTCVTTFLGFCEDDDADDDDDEDDDDDDGNRAI